ncbi:FliM/FliN family flagellar motor switch protein [Paracoccus caeni]|uniref:FliM/FliN family flagellar motor switch protein n=1 Tax=Paracoccus caeni TaxID=657651 RepID=A0A934VVV3_9RHOB|nr:FliM/FliN family flagellar motor C-terminal domain-containing protein [Paracoccus caeni]MBK4217351.1 FliM/FliN family flagellar motor switch protein [Paracoccus caeni]
MNDLSEEGGGQSGMIRQFLRRQGQGAGQAGTFAHPSVPQPLTPIRAAGLAIGRAAQRLYQMALRPVSIRVDAISQADLTERLPERALLALLQGPGDLLGVMALCPQAVAALIEMQAVGRITNRALDQRKLTRSDALLCAEFIDATMAEIGEDLSGLDGIAELRGYRYAGYLDDPRPLGLMLEDQGFLGLDFEVELGSGQTRRAQIFVALPHIAEARGSAQDAPAADMPAPQLPGATLDRNMQDAPVDLIGILCRRRISLGELRDLKQGALLRLPRVDLAEARIETADGQLLATGKFGEADGCHAIRLIDAEQAARPDAPAMAPPGRAGHRSFGEDIYAGVDPVPVDVSDPDIFRQPQLADDENLQNVTERASRPGQTA